MFITLIYSTLNVLTKLHFNFLYSFFGSKPSCLPANLSFSEPALLNHCTRIKSVSNSVLLKTRSPLDSHDCVGYHTCSPFLYQQFFFSSPCCSSHHHCHLIFPSYISCLGDWSVGTETCKQFSRDNKFFALMLPF